MKYLTKDKRRKVRSAASRAKWDDFPFTISKPMKDCSEYDNCYHSYWLMNYDKDGVEDGIYVQQADSKREAEDKLYRIAAKLLKVKL